MAGRDSKKSSSGIHPFKSLAGRIKHPEGTGMGLEKMMVLILGADQAAKAYIDSRPAENYPQPVPYTDGKLMLYRNHNAGLPFGKLENDQDLIKFLGVGVTSMLAGSYVYLKIRDERKFFRFALSLAIGGSLSNLIDRFTRGYVVDYLCIKEGDLGKVVFNLGDLCVISGFLLIGVLEASRILGHSGS